MNNTEIEENIELLLPFYLNGTLADDEKKRVEAAIAENINLQQELTFLKHIQAQVLEQQEQQSPGELGLKRLQKMLKKEQANNQQQSKNKSISATKNRWQLVAMAACLVIVVQTVVQLKPDSDQFVAAGGKLINLHHGEIVSVTFAPNVTEQDIRNLLLETNTSIVDGPSALGIYRLSIAGDSEVAINRFKSSANLIESVQQE